MVSEDIRAVRDFIAAQPPKAGMTLAQRRANSDRWNELFPTSPDVRLAPTTIGGVAAEWVRAPGARDDGVLLYLHGGGYVFGSPLSHRHFVANLSAETGLQGLLLDYRLAPEHPFPAAVDDALVAYRALLDGGHSAGRIVVAGDSAGGGLAVSLMLAARGAGLPMPAAGICLSPWTDLTQSAGSYTSRAKTDPNITRDGLDALAAHYLAGADPRNPLASPLFGDLAGLPPLLIHVGGAEVLVDDAVNLYKRASEAGVAATLEVWDDMVHVWHRYFPMLREGREANARIAEFVHDLYGEKAAAAE